MQRVIASGFVFLCMLTDIFKLLRNMAGFTESPYVMPYPIDLAEPMASCFPAPVLVLDTSLDRIWWASPGMLHFAKLQKDEVKRLSAREFLQSYFYPDEEILALYDQRASAGTYTAWFKADPEPRFIVGIWTALKAQDRTPTRFMMVFQDATDIETSRQQILQYSEELRQQLEIHDAFLQEKDSLLQELREKNLQLHLLEVAFCRGKGIYVLMDSEGQVLYHTSLRQDKAVSEAPPRHIRQLREIAYFKENENDGEEHFILDQIAKAPFTQDVFFPYMQGGKWYSLSILPVQREEDESSYYQVILHDIDSVKRREQALERQNKEIQSSLNYAAKIRQQFMNDLDICKRYFSDFGVLYEPKEKVGGDFYYLHEVEGGLILFIGDTIGHGMASALLSMYVQALLQQSIKYAGSSLESLYDYLVAELSSKDGPVDIEMAILRWHPTEHTLHYMGVGRPLWLLRDGEIYELTGAGRGLSVNTPPVQTIRILPGDRLFLFSDGIVDQLDERGKRFGTGKMRNILLHIGLTHSISEVIETVKNTLYQWQGKEPQTDDRLFIALEA